METKEQVLNAIRVELDKWMKHSVRGMKSGNPAYFQGKITLILDLFDFIHDIDSEESEKPVPNDLEEAADEYEKKHTYQRYDGGGLTPEYDATLAEAVIFGAKWQAEQLLKSSPLPEDTVLFNKGVEEGKRLMMEDAVKWLVDDDYHEASEKGRFILGSVGLGYNGYYIPYLDLLKLPKEDEK